MGASNIGVFLPIWELFPILDVILDCFLKIVFSLAHSCQYGKVFTNIGQLWFPDIIDN